MTKNNNGTLSGLNRDIMDMRHKIENSGQFSTAEDHAAMAYRLGIMCLEGRDCSRDFVSAHKWLNIAAIKGFEHAAQARADLSNNMSKADIARALREAREWMLQN